MRSLTRTTLTIALGALVLVTILLTRLHSYLLFHSIAELFSIVVAIAVFIYAWNARRIMKNNYLLVIGISFLFFGILDLIHTLAYNGMGVFTTYDSNLPTSLWIASRYLLAGSFLLAPLLIGKVLKSWLMLAGYFIVTALLLLSIFYWNIFPVSYIEGSGLTPFKIISEYIISGIFLLAVAGLWRKRSAFAPRVFWLMTVAILVSIFSELAFTQYIGVYSSANLLGHLFEVVAFYLVYEAILVTGFQQPIEILFRNLNEVNKALKDSESRFRLLAENSKDIIFRYRLPPESGFEYVSPSVTRITGYTPEEFYADPDLMLKVVHPDDRAELESVFNNSESLQGTPFVQRWARKDGKIIWIEGMITLVLDNADTPIAAQGAAREITERRMAEEALQKSEERYRTLFSNMTEGFALHEIICDEEGHPVDYLFLDINPAFETLMGLKRKDVIGNLVSQVLPGIEAQWIETYGKVALSGQAVKFENYSGALNRYYQVFAYSPAPKQFAVLFMDVTQHKQAEASIAHLASFPALNPHPVAEFSGDGNAIYTNKPTKDLFPDLESSGAQHPYLAEWQNVVSQLRNGRDNHIVREVKVGEQHYMQTIQYVKAKDVFRIYATDITQRKRAEQLKDDFIGMVSHELRTPLTVIGGAIQTAMDKRVSQKNRFELLKDAVWGTQSLGNMLENLLELSRYQASRLMLDKKRISAAVIIKKAVKRTSKQHPKRKVIINLPGRLPMITIDPDRLERILCNLLDNAFKYSPQGGNVYVFTQKEKGSLVIGVKDEGQGIALKDQQVLFEPFRRLQAEEQAKGIGLGLVVCKRLVEVHGGRIWVESKPDEGATFKFTIPLDRPNVE